MRAERTSGVPEIPGGQWVASPLRQQQSGLAPYVEAVRGHGLLVALIIGVVVAAAVGWLALRTPQYEASAEIFVTPLPAESVSLVGIPLLQDLREPTRTIQTAAALVSSQAAAVRTAREVELGATGVRRVRRIARARRLEREVGAHAGSSGKSRGRDGAASHAVERQPVGTPGKRTRELDPALSEANRQAHGLL